MNGGCSSSCRVNAKLNSPVPFAAAAAACRVPALMGKHFAIESAGLGQLDLRPRPAPTDRSRGLLPGFAAGESERTHSTCESL